MCPRNYQLPVPLCCSIILSIAFTEIKNTNQQNVHTKLIIIKTTIVSGLQADCILQLQK